MKTIRQIAEEISVSRQAIYYKINKPPLSNILQPLLSKENGVLTVSIDGEILIKQAFLNERCQKKLSKENTLFDSELTKLLHDTIDTLKMQLYAKDKQIEELTATIKIQAENFKHKPPKKVYTRKKQIVLEPKSTPIKRLIKYRK